MRIWLGGMSLVAALVAGSAKAGVFPKGNSTVVMKGVLADNDPTLEATVFPQKDAPFVIASDKISGKVSSEVHTSVKTGKAHIYVRVHNDRLSQRAISGFMLRGWANYPFEAEFRLDGLGDISPAIATRIADPDFPGSTAYRISFAEPIPPGRSSRYFFMKTPAIGTLPARLRIISATGKFTEVQGIKPRM